MTKLTLFTLFLLTSLYANASLEEHLVFESIVDGKCRQMHKSDMAIVKNTHPSIKVEAKLRRFLAGKPQPGFNRISLEPGESTKLGCDKTYGRKQVWAVYRMETAVGDSVDSTPVEAETPITEKDENYVLNQRCAEFLKIPEREDLTSSELQAILIKEIQKRSIRPPSMGTRENVTKPLRQCYVVVKDQKIIDSLEKLGLNNSFLYVK